MSARASRSRDNRTTQLMVVADIILFIASYLLAYLVRFEGDIPERHMGIFKMTLPPMVLCKIALAYNFGLYRGMWRYTSISDLLNVLKTCIGATVLITTALLVFQGFSGFSRATFFLDGLFTFLFIGGLRVGIRLYFTHSFEQFFSPRPSSNSTSKVLLIIGAGDLGERVAREFAGHKTSTHRVAGFLDDDPSKVGKYIHGFPVLGNTHNLKSIVRKSGVAEVVMAISETTPQKMRAIVKACEEVKVKCNILPSTTDILDDKVGIERIREFSFEDLLGREPVEMEIDRIGDYLMDKRVLVTGAGGSIGSELCRQIARFAPANLLLLDRAESTLYEIEMELKHSLGDRISCEPVLVDVQTVEVLRDVFEHFRPEVVFHAAAYKHVPMLELHPWEAVFNNVLGTQNLLQLCHEFEEVERFVLVSTDKAVRPTNVMGTTKRVTELLMQCYDVVNTHTAHQAVRFGNVVGSSGSVIPLFKKQIARGESVTVTHPDITRYFMTIPEAAQLILQAGAMGTGGELFILDMGTPVKIVDLAKDLIRLSGFEPGVDIPIEFVGLRPGEKLFEELITSGEGIVTTEHKKIMVLRAEESDDATPEEFLENLQTDIQQLVELARAHDAPGIRKLLQKMVPEYTPTPNDSEEVPPIDSR